MQYEDTVSLDTLEAVLRDAPADETVSVDYRLTDNQQHTTNYGLGHSAHGDYGTAPTTEQMAEYVNALQRVGMDGYDVLDPILTASVMERPDEDGNDRLIIDYRAQGRVAPDIMPNRFGAGLEQPLFEMSWEHEVASEAAAEEYIEDDLGLSVPDRH